jgi:hypothetical protein
VGVGVQILGNTLEVDGNARNNCLSKNYELYLIAFLDKEVSTDERIYKMWFSVFFL